MANKTKHALSAVKLEDITELTKGAWGMPWLSEAKKDVTSCDKPRGGANIPRSADLRMGQPTGSDSGTPRYEGGERRELKHLSTCRKRK